MSHSELYPLRLTPVYKNYLWGGDFLRRLACDGDLLPSPPIAEAWLVSDHENGKTLIANGALAGKTLGEVCGDSFPLLVKILDAQQSLSVQVHPDAAAMNALGITERPKSEAWIILHAEENSVYYAGLSRDATEKELLAACENGTLEPLLHEIPARVGDCIFLPAGTLHALGKGIVALEVQTCSDVTFRLFDWNRRDANGNSRRLDVRESLASIRMPTSTLTPYSPHGKITREPEILCQCEYFSVRRWNLAASPLVWQHNNNNDEQFHIFVAIEGTTQIVFENFEKFPTEELRVGEALLIPAAIQPQKIQAQHEKSVLIDITP